MIKAIETHYSGHHYRSRLEARWAIYFDHIGVDFEYESEGYEVAAGVCYLPDFFLPDYKCHVEVKHKGGSFKKAELFAADSDILLLEGPPKLKSYRLLYSADRLDGNYIIHWMPVCLSHAAIESFGAGSFYYSDHYYFDDEDDAAVTAANTARFEHGETPQIPGYIERNDTEKIRRFLGSNVVLKGVGPVMAERMVDRFGSNIIDVLDLEPERLTEVCGMGPLRAARVAKDWKEYRALGHD